MLQRTAAVFAASLLCSTTLSAQTPVAPWDSVAAILKAPATRNPDHVRFGFPRRDITLKIGDVTVSPALALGTWAGFTGKGAATEMMGDLVLLPEELAPVLEQLQQEHISVTAIHNHLAGSTPAIVYVHYHAMGAASDLAHRLDRVLARTATPRPVAPAAATPLAIDTALVFRMLGKSGKAQGKVAQLGFNLVPGVVRIAGRVVPAGPGYGTPINIQMVDSVRAVATGDFSILGERTQPVIAALTSHGITATAMHTHLIGETPKIYYIHFWADGPLQAVLAGLRAALDAARPQPVRAR